MARSGTVIGPLTVYRDCAGRCQKPVRLTLQGSKNVLENDASTTGRYLPSVSELGNEQFWNVNPTHSLDMDVRCRKCPACLRARAKLWRQRMVSEIRAAERTWFITLTLSPEAHYKALCAARLRLSRGGTRFDELSPEEQFAERHRSINDELTRFVKRVRKNSGSEIRLILVCEAHKSGLPHYHGLIHEGSIDRPVRYSVLKNAWREGFGAYKLVHEGDAPAGYCAKYLSKSALARVRASQGYGRGLSDALKA